MTDKHAPDALPAQQLAALHSDADKARAFEWLRDLATSEAAPPEAGIALDTWAALAATPDSPQAPALQSESYYLWEHPTLTPRVARVTDARFAHGDPQWVRCYPVEVQAPAPQAVVGEASDEHDFDEPHNAEWYTRPIQQCRKCGVIRLKPKGRSAYHYYGKEHMGTGHHRCPANFAACGTSASPAPSAAPHQGADALREAETTASASDRAIMRYFKVEPGSREHFWLLMAPYHLQMVTGNDAENLQAFALDVWCAALAHHQAPQAEMRNRAVRFVTGSDGRVIEDDDFTHDASLKISGDFGSDEDRHAYAQGLCDRLNATSQAVVGEANELFAIANELHGEFDKQTYDEKRKAADWDLPDDHEFSITITVAQERALSMAIIAYENWQAKSIAAPHQGADALREALEAAAEEIEVGHPWITRAAASAILRKHATLAHHQAPQQGEQQ